MAERVLVEGALSHIRGRCNPRVLVGKPIHPGQFGEEHEIRGASLAASESTSLAASGWLEEHTLAKVYLFLVSAVSLPTRPL